MTKKSLMALLIGLEESNQTVTIRYAIGKQEPRLLRRDCGIIEKVIRQRKSCLNEHLQLKLAEDHWAWIKISRIKEVEVNGEIIFQI